MRISKIAVLFIVPLCFVGTGNASLMTVDSILNPTVIDFDGFPTLGNLSGPVQLGAFVGEDITVAGDPNVGLYVNPIGWGLGGNGNWGNGMTFIGGNSARPGSFTFSFNDGPVSAVGGFMNHVPDRGTDLFISAFDSNMNLLESYNITTLAEISTPGGLNAGGFRGIERGFADISYFSVYGYVPVLDDLTFSRAAPVPEPASLLLLGTGLVGLVASRIGKKRGKDSEGLPRI